MDIWQSTNWKCTSKYIIVCGLTFIIEAYLHICSSLEGFSTFFQPISNLRRVVNPIVFFYRWKIWKSPAKHDRFLWTIQDWPWFFYTVHHFSIFFFKKHVSRLFKHFPGDLHVWCHGYPGAPGPRPGRLKEVYDLSRTTSALSKRVGDPSWMVYFDPKIRSGGTPTTGMKPPSIEIDRDR